MNNLSKLRHARGMSQQELAERLHTTAVSVGRYEREDQRLTLPLLRRLAKILDVGIAEIAGDAWQSPEHYSVPIFDLRSAANAGLFADNAQPTGHLLFREQWLRSIASNVSALFVIAMSGDSMWETLHDGDHILVDPSQNDPRREGLHVIRLDDILQIKRLSMHPVKKLLTVKSDNPAYPTYENVEPGNIAVVGRVVWIGRSVI